MGHCQNELGSCLVPLHYRSSHLCLHGVGAPVNWQPIETAPKTGQEIYVYDFNDWDGKVSLVYWGRVADRYGDWAGNEYHWVRVFLNEWDPDGDDSQGHYVVMNPSHWRPVEVRQKDFDDYKVKPPYPEGEIE